MVEQTPQKYLVDPPSEPLYAIHHHHRHPLVVTLAQLRLAVDIDLLGRKAVPGKQLHGLVAQMATLPRINDYVVHENVFFFVGRAFQRDVAAP